MFDKVLVANRGEIAIRVMRTCRRLGIKTVAVHSDIDVHAQHVLEADEAYNIGPAPSAESYLLGDKIIDVCLATGAQAVHPGYGFLSENAEFSEKCAAHGITFVGPPAKAIVDMGSKSASKNIMIDAGVPVTPGYHGENQDPQHLKQQADDMGYPVMLKAVLGGGGKGMRMVAKEEDFFDALDACKREAMKGFADDAMLIEKFLTQPRHVELQVFADTHGNAVHMNERDCSLQRRMQKVLEEAPAPGMSAAQRAKMGKAATDAARAVGYVGAGTVEFLLDTDGSFYFMEMNTRLQVEHPVSEMVTGQDFVEWQLRVAAGEPLPLRQEDVPLRGHAIEARIYAENPDNDFLPGSGHVHFDSPPAGCGSFGLDSTVRVDAGVKQGNDVSIYYDPMISKLIVHGKDRAEALRILDGALADYRVVGLPTNIEFVRRCARHPAFVDADLDINFIEKHQDALLPKVENMPPTRETVALVALAHVLEEVSGRTEADTGNDASSSPWISAGLSGMRVGVGTRGGGASRTLSLECVSGNVDVQIEYPPGESAAMSRDGEVELLVTVRGTDGVDSAPIKVSGSLDLPSGALVAKVDGARRTATAVRLDDQWHVFPDGEDVRSEGSDGPGATCGRHMYAFKVPVADYSSGAGAGGSMAITTPMPGKVVQLACSVGDTMDKGEPLLILEAMKMEHVIRAPSDGVVVERLPFGVGDFVEDGQILVGFAEDTE
jgi:3-methylcrotonyl-CoA carboxylase alpha subunit